MRTILSIILMISVSGLLASNPFKGDRAVVKSEFIYKPEEVSFPSCHASTIAQTDGGLVAAWFGGTHEKHPDVGI